MCTRWIYQYVLTSCYWFENIIIKTNQCVSLAISMPKQNKRITKKRCIVRLIITILSKYVIIWTFQTMLITIFISDDSIEKLTISVTRGHNYDFLKQKSLHISYQNILHVTQQLNSHTSNLYSKTEKMISESPLKLFNFYVQYAK